MDVNRQQIAKAADAIRQRSRHTPRIGIVLGSGLGVLAADVEQATVIPFVEIPHFPRPTVEGHPGRLHIGLLATQPVALMEGRLHHYEGYSMAQVTMPVRVMRALGIQTVILTNAAGGLNPHFTTGDLMLITDHIALASLAGNNPLRGPNDAAWGPRFPDMTVAYDVALRRLALKVATQQGIRLHQGIYAYVGGPTYETPAEVRFLRSIGADAVGMSTVPEVIVARHAGMRVLAISAIGNIAQAQPDAPTVTSHRDVLKAGQTVVPHLIALLKGVLAALSNGE